MATSERSIGSDPKWPRRIAVANMVLLTLALDYVILPFAILGWRMPDAILVVILSGCAVSAVRRNGPRWMWLYACGIVIVYGIAWWILGFNTFDPHIFRTPPFLTGSYFPGWFQVLVGSVYGLLLVYLIRHPRA